MPGPSSLTVTVTRPGSSSTSTQARARSPQCRRTLSSAARTAAASSSAAASASRTGPGRHRRPSPAPTRTRPSSARRSTSSRRRRAAARRAPTRARSAASCSPGQPAELGRPRRPLGAAPLHQRQHLQHRVVDVAGQAFPFPAGRLELGGRAGVRSRVGGEPGQVPDDHAGQQQQHDAVERDGDRLAAQQEVQPETTRAATAPARLPYGHRPGQHRPATQVAVRSASPSRAPSGRRSAAPRAQQQAAVTTQVGAQQRPARAAPGGRRGTPPPPTRRPSPPAPARRRAGRRSRVEGAHDHERRVRQRGEPEMVIARHSGSCQTVGGGGHGADPDTAQTGGTSQPSQRRRNLVDQVTTARATAGDVRWERAANISQDAGQAMTDADALSPGTLAPGDAYLISAILAGDEVTGRQHGGCRLCRNRRPDRGPVRRLVLVCQRTDHQRRTPRRRAGPAAALVGGERGAVRVIDGRGSGPRPAGPAGAAGAGQWSAAGACGWCVRLCDDGDGQHRPGRDHGADRHPAGCRRHAGQHRSDSH